MNTKSNLRKWSGIQLNERRAKATGMMLLPLLLLLMLPSVVQAQQVYTNNYGPWYYTTTNDIITITGYTGANGDVTIPDRIPDTTNGLPVTSIGDWTFWNCSSLTSITIPNSVTSIGDGAFCRCSNLRSVTIPNSVTNIGDYAFNGCSGLTSVTIGSSVTNIGDYAFSETALGSIAIPNSVISIGTNSFSECPNLAYASLGSGVTSIGDAAFLDCTNLLAINVNVDNSFFTSVDGVLFNKDQTALIQFPVGSGAVSYTIPNGVTSIGVGAFAYCASLLSVTIPSSDINIGAGAFFWCPNLSAILCEGNCPNANLSISGIPPDNLLFGVPYYGGSYNPIVYYLQGATGWTSGFDSQALLWNPTVQAAGVQSNQFGFDIAGTTNIPVSVEAATNLASEDWVPLQFIILTNGSFHFTDSNQAVYPARFYRIGFWPGLPPSYYAPGAPPSSRRFKEDIRSMDAASEALYSLQPVTFRYKRSIDPTGSRQWGLVAEEVAKAEPDLVVRDEKGQIFGVRYEAVNAMLLNEFLKEHRKVEEQNAKIQALEQSVAELKAAVERIANR